MVEPAVSNSNAKFIDDLIDDIHCFFELIRHPDPKATPGIHRIQQASEELSSKLAAFASAVGERHAATCDSVKALAERLRAFTEELEVHPSQNKSLVKQREMLARSYEELLLELKKRRIEGVEITVQTHQLKPTNYIRNLFHIIMGLTGVTLYYFLLTHTQAVIILGTLLAVFTVLEITRRFSNRWNDYLVDRVFGRISRPSERYRVNSATQYLIALTLIVWLFPKMPALAATLVLCFSDPAASLAGKRWGNRKLYRDKSFVGTLAFFLVGVLAVGTLLMFDDPGMGIARIAVVSSVISLAGAVTELFSTRIDDNFSVPVVCVLTGTLLL